MSATPAVLLAPLVVALALISWAVRSLIQRTDDDDRDSTELSPYDAPTDPVLAAWDGGRP